MKLRWLIRGRVQGVGFRYFVLRRALALDLAGWARNLPDGAVEVVAQGDPESLATLEVALRSGPSHARVEQVDREEMPDQPALPKSFDIK
jgi:acylphosphatase